MSTLVVPTPSCKIPRQVQLEWFRRHAKAIPADVRALAYARFAAHADSDRVFRWLLNMEGEAYLIEMAREEEADWWVYWLVARAGWELVMRYYKLDVEVTRAMGSLKPDPAKLWCDL